MIYELSLIDKIKLYLLDGAIFLGFDQKPAWSKPMPVFLKHCWRHGLYETIPQGWYDELADCPECYAEWYEQVQEVIYHGPRTVR